MCCGTIRLGDWSENVRQGFNSENMTSGSFPWQTVWCWYRRNRKFLCLTCTARRRGVCEKILDMLFVKLSEYHMLFDFRWEYLLYYIESDRDVLSCCNVADVPITITSRVIDLPDSQSKEIAMTIAMDDAIDLEAENAVYTDRQWNLIYRHYRFAVMSWNLYDAYRWMYLVLEQAMQIFVPILPMGW